MDSGVSNVSCYIQEHIIATDIHTIPKLNNISINVYGVKIGFLTRKMIHEVVGPLRSLLSHIN